MTTGGDHVVRVLGERPRIQDEDLEVHQAERPVRGDPVPDRMLHEGIRRDDEVAGDPASDEESHRGQEVPDPREPPLAPDEQRQEARFEEEREEPLHRERLPDHAARVATEPGPVGAELKLHGDARDHADREVDAEDPDPEPSRVVPPLSVPPGSAASGLLSCTRTLYGTVHGNRAGPAKNTTTDWEKRQLCGRSRSPSSEDPRS